MKISYNKSTSELTMTLNEVEQDWLRNVIQRRGVDCNVSVQNMLDKDNTDYSPSEKEVIRKTWEEVEARYQGFLWQMRNAIGYPNEVHEAYPIVVGEFLPPAYIHF